MQRYEQVNRIGVGGAFAADPADKRGSMDGWASSASRSI